MSRADAERAYQEMGNVRVDGNYLRLDWGKPVTLPERPIVLRTTNASKNGDSRRNDRHESAGSSSTSDSEAEGSNEQFAFPPNATIVKVEFPNSIRQRVLINRVASYVADCGHEFEQMLMEKEGTNQDYKFLFEQGSPENTYYRWKVNLIISH